ncbi:MAG: BsuPI-related putative proteinase inhibitor [Bacillota bacterium]
MKRVLLIVLALCLVFVNLPVAANDSSQGSREPAKKVAFSDVSGHWAKNVIEKMADTGVIRGVGNGKFLPDVKMKRSEFAVALHKAAGIVMNYIKAPDINEFYSDVKNEDWYASPLYDLAVLNIIDDRGKFRPDDLITREEMVHYIVNAYSYKLGIIVDELEESADKFSDDDKIDPKFNSDVKKAVKLGFIMGRGNNRFVPKGITTRAEALVVLDRLMTALSKLSDGPVIERPGDKAEGKVDVEPLFIKDGDFYKMIVKITNNTGREIKIDHSSGQKYDFMLLDSKKDILYQWSADKKFIMMLTETIIPAGETVKFSENLDKPSYEAVADKAVYFKALIAGVCESFKIDENGYEIKLKAKADDGLTVEPGYEKGTDVFKMKLKITNSLKKEITINHTSSQKYDFKLLDSNKEIIYTWSSDKLFMMMLTDTVIGAGETVEFVEELDMESFKDFVNKAKYLKAFISGTSEDVYIDSEGYEVEIK